jgi:phage-related protein
MSYYLLTELGDNLTTELEEKIELNYSTFEIGGTGDAEPVITLTADEDHGTATISISNGTETIIWTGAFDNADVLVIDCSKWLVTLNGTASMSGVSGEFPLLKPSTTSLTITGFSGKVEITYRSRYL